jgi:polysaccharide biosynthesis protein VpsQ
MKVTIPKQGVILRLVFVIYAIAFIGIIVAADRGKGSWMWDFVGAIPLGDKLGHLVLVGTLSLLLNSVLGKRRAPWRLRFMMLGSLLLLVGMSLEEASQCLNANRTCDLFDWLANVAGITVGQMLLQFDSSD